MSVIKALVALATMSGCIIHAEDWGKLGDTGDSVVGEPDHKADYILLPSGLEPGAVSEVLLTATPNQDWATVVALDVMGPMDIESFTAEDNGLVLAVSVPSDAEQGPVHIVLEYDDGTFDIARDAIEILGADAPSNDTGLTDDQPEG